MRGIRCLLTAVLAAGIVAVVTAQPGGGRGFGGGGQDVHTLVFTNAALQEEIKVTPAQKEKIKPIAEKFAELNKKRGEMFGKGGGKGKGGFDKDKMAEFQEESKKLTEDSKKSFDEIFTSAQKKRLDQISIQAMGVNVFAEPREGKGGGKGGGFGGGMSEAQKATKKEVADALKLTDEQKSKIKGIMAEYGKDAASIRKDVFGDTKGKGGFGKVDPEQMKELQTKTTKLSMETMSKIADVLDDTQKTAWKGLVGDAFDTSKLTPVPPKKD